RPYSPIAPSAEIEPVVGDKSTEVTVIFVLFRINDGTQNLDKIVFDAANRTLTHDVYIAK
ncbi:hypothetical protein N9W39_01940, partial [Alphaproteobacteria bacterium]|nr:hypothetical protein [Alphaproteobacteria bacterium]